MRGGAACRYLVTTSDYSTPADARLIGPLPHKYHDFHSSPKQVPLLASDSKDNIKEDAPPLLMILVLRPVILLPG